MTANKSITHQRSAVPRQRLRLRDIIRRRLVACGWCKQVQILCEEIIKENEGRNISFDMLITKILPHAREMVPLSFNEDLQEELRTTEICEDYEDEEELIIIDLPPRYQPANTPRYQQGNAVSEQGNAAHEQGNASNDQQKNASNYQEKNATNEQENAKNQENP